ncbi:MAG: glycoside hydrolase family 127 protein [Betaproteobacteria bacterium]
MRTILLALLAAAAGAAAPVSPDYPIKPVPLTDVRITDHFWAPKIEINRTVTIPHIMRQNELTGRVDNFLKAAHAIPGEYKGHRYDDTDVYKVIEAASYLLAAHPDPVLDGKVDELIAIIARAQEPDGYIYSARTADPAHPAPGAGPERWSWLSTSHELYNQGHLYEAAVAHYQATGKRTLLDVAIKSANLVCKVFGPNGRHDAPGHEEVELALVKLYRVTGDRRYLDEAKFFLDQRGRPHTDPPHQFAADDPFAIYDSLQYRQDDVPVVDQRQAEGHAVRAMYLYNGITDVATLDNQPAYGAAVDRLWNDVVSKRMYLTGGLGSVGRTEAFGDDYVLPNRAYAETCASVGGLLWYHRMFLREGDAKYYDTFERTLYNGYLSGVSLSGDSFFYQNPLVSDGRVERSKYFDVACCPANLARLMGQLPGLVYAQRPGEVYVNLYIGSDATFAASGTRLHLIQTTDYPWSGRVTLRVDPDQSAEFDLALRVPGWARGEAVPGDLYRFTDAGGGRSRNGVITLTVNGKPVPVAPVKGYARIRRRWTKGDVVRLDLPMPVHRVVANSAVAEDRGRAAIQRGPVVYCLEGIDNGGRVLDTVVPLDEKLTATFRPDLLGGVEVITGKAITAVPYYAWNNRGKGEMVVWARAE